MNFVKEARTLVNYIECIESFNFINTSNKPKYNHIGALITDIILQSGLNYNNVVKPRVLNLAFNYPDANNLKGFIRLIDIHGLDKLIDWKHQTKLQRIQAVNSLLSNIGINTCEELEFFLEKNDNRNLFLEIKGFGPKTLDYMLKLLNFDTVAVDRHIYSFVKEAGIQQNDYYNVKKIVEYAADFMNISRSSIDFSIWSYMSSQSKDSKQLKLSF